MTLLYTLFIQLCLDGILDNLADKQSYLDLLNSQSTLQDNTLIFEHISFHKGDKNCDRVVFPESVLIHLNPL